MFEVTSTGQNLKYGVKGARIRVRDTLLIQLLKDGWIETDKVLPIGNDSRGRRKKVITDESMAKKNDG